MRKPNYTFLNHLLPVATQKTPFGTEKTATLGPGITRHVFPKRTHTRGCRKFRCLTPRFAFMLCCCAVIDMAKGIARGSRVKASQPFPTVETREFAWQRNSSEVLGSGTTRHVLPKHKHTKGGSELSSLHSSCCCAITDMAKRVARGSRISPFSIIR